jgi:hypothetical protein
MSWKFAGIAFARSYAANPRDLLRRLGLPDADPGAELTFAEATSRRNEGTAVGIVNGRTLLLDHLLPYDCAYEPGREGPLDERLRSLSVGGDILNFVCDGASGTYCFSLFRQGERIRRWAGDPDGVSCDEGSPLAAEAELPADTRAANALAAGIYATNFGEIRQFAVWEAFLGVAFEELVQDDRPRFTRFD